MECGPTSGLGAPPARGLLERVATGGTVSRKTLAWALAAALGLAATVAIAIWLASGSQVAQPSKVEPGSGKTGKPWWDEATKLGSENVRMAGDYAALQRNNDLESATGTYDADAAYGQMLDRERETMARNAIAPKGQKKNFPIEKAPKATLVENPNKLTGRIWAKGAEVGNVDLRYEVIRDARR